MKASPLSAPAFGFDRASDTILTITGPTGVGKTDLSLQVARDLEAEIVSADSRQVYRALSVGTAKPSFEERTTVPHHFVHEIRLEDPFSAGRFARLANERIRSIRARGRTALVVGGSTLYLHALQHGLAEIPEIDPDLRESLNARLVDEGPQRLYDELEAVDPAYACTLDPTKTQRLVRGLEVYHGTGRPLSHFHDQTPEPPFRYHTVVLQRPRPQLYDRINRRVDAMLRRGLLHEVRRLVRRGAPLDAAPLRTIGYREPLRYLREEIDYEEMVRLIKRDSRRYAKRQLTWFRRYDTYRFFDLQ